MVEPICNHNKLPLSNPPFELPRVNQKLVREIIIITEGTMTSIAFKCVWILPSSIPCWNKRWMAIYSCYQHSAAMNVQLEEWEAPSVIWSSSASPAKVYHKRGDVRHILLPLLSHHYSSPALWLILLQNSAQKKGALVRPLARHLATASF